MSSEIKKLDGEKPSEDKSQKTIKIDEGRHSLRVDWEDLRTYILSAYGAVGNWYLYCFPTGEEKKLSDFKTLDQTQTRVQFDKLKAGTSYIVEVLWTFADKRNNGARFFLEHKFAKSWAESSTQQGWTLSAPSGWKDDKEGLHARLQEEIIKLAKFGRMNVAIVGLQGVGKSSFLNTLVTAFSYSRFNSLDSVESVQNVGASSSHVTKEISYKSIVELAPELSEQLAFLKNLWLVDTCGWTYDVKDVNLPLILRGHLGDGWQLGADISDHKLKGYVKEPGLEEMIHACVFINGASQLFMQADEINPETERLKYFRMEAEKCGIYPQLLISKPDTVDYTLRESFQDVFASELIMETLNHVRGAGFSEKNTHVGMFYHSHKTRDILIEIVAMSVLLAAMRMARNFIIEYRRRNPTPDRKTPAQVVKPTGKKPPCPYGAEHCEFKDEDHLAEYSHQEKCPKGHKCKLIDSASHLEKYIHLCPHGDCKIKSESHLLKYYHEKQQARRPSVPKPITTPHDPSDDEEEEEPDSTQEGVPVKRWTTKEVLEWHDRGDSGAQSQELRLALLGDNFTGADLLDINQEILKSWHIAPTLANRFLRRVKEELLQQSK